MSSNRLAVPALALLASLVAASDAPAAVPPGPSAPIIAALEKGDVDAAVTAADAAVKACPKDVDVLRFAGRAYGAKAQTASVFTKVKWAKRCREVWEKAVEVAPADVDARYDLMQYYLFAPGVIGGGVEKARAQAAEIGRHDLVAGHLAAGRIAEHEEKPAEAEAAYRRAMDGDPNGTRGLLALAGFLGGQERWAEARALFEKRLAAAPDDAFAVYQLGKLALLSGQGLEKGLALFDKYLATPEAKGRPTHADARWRKGLLLEKLGRKPAAIAEYREALRADPAHPQAKRELERLKPA